MIGNYITFTALLFFITFFAGVFIRYFKTKTIVPGKMLSAKKGGVFEFYPVVFGIIAVFALLHLALGLDPFDRESFYSEVISIILFTFVFYLFSVFVLVFVFYLGTRVAFKLRNTDPRPFYDKHSVTIINLAIWISIFFASIFMIALLYIAVVR